MAPGHPDPQDSIEMVSKDPDRQRSRTRPGQLSVERLTSYFIVSLIKNSIFISFGKPGSLLFESV